MPQITVSIPEELVQWIDSEAEASAKSRSRYVSEVFKAMSGINVEIRGPGRPGGAKSRRSVARKVEEDTGQVLAPGVRGDW